MSETIPEDIREAAKRAYRQSCSSHDATPIEAALMAEREKAARLADPIEYPGLAEASDIEKHAHDLRTLISRAIRRGTSACKLTKSPRP